MYFKQNKHDFLIKKDKSRKGSIDKNIIPLVNLINSIKDYYTTSSCGGRIIILTNPKSGKRQDSKWLFMSHEKTSYNKLKKALKKLPEDELWFKFESVILHITCKDIDAAQKLLDIARNLGLKRSGIITTRKKIVVEIFDTEKIDTIIANKGKFVITEDYLRLLTKLANKKLEKRDKKIKKFICLLKPLQ